MVTPPKSLTTDPVTYDPLAVPGAAFLGGLIYNRNAGGGTGQGTHPVTIDLLIGPLCHLMGDVS